VALSACQPLVSQIEMVDLPRADWTQKEPLPVAAEETSIAHYLEHLRPAVDDDGELLAREGSVGRAG
jgi:hypothetical protein